MTLSRPSRNWWINPDMKIFNSLILIFLLGTSGPALLWAHGGGHDAEPKKEETALPELPKATISMKTTESGANEYGVSDPMDAFEMGGVEEVEGGGALWGEEPQPEMSEHEGHDMSKMKHVEPAEHEWISTSQKGYGWAAALTVFSGLVFGFLTFKRPCE
jgi:hypothetical protein